MRPILWGIIVLVLSAIGWVISVVLNVVTLGSLRWVSNMFGIIALFSIPASVIWEIIRKKRVRPGD
ncbi:MAG: hypothetical protein A3B99_04030 [Candidatus Yanofskybacteria bacterium RIFCSPHIGHO2_02_FULL_44_12b]|uniref:Uncharacterized protein n=1 Tax=Candidatus Yanofskybacteria bacterium RIFCSPLOWO2_01_FULL_44_22 TaxID=1802697 RepID=A0A1F8GN32_9BACT|nr:MAG: hypothetical protein A2659_00810 [Candidatus Yanofskybacteria bacterium RIFCSPHIGHO2_01_FULL_44_24]OGN15685.1 MAG: hypothetical protein A3B99_04030 [Candidatus Yanofskybacteria bacterium RIFCSPHIGHO2_02_FULL_44_12b]OGN26741.1 MAG: hypothetical protein A2925_04115 [Candidatus Yanofskybacteria bacterium RIFCSPLOWO2_01_FULL_44_22]